MRDLTEEELKWVSKEQFEYCDCEGIECPICNIYMPEDVAAPLFEKRIALEVEQGKKAEEDNQREKSILAKPENEWTNDEGIFIFRRNNRRIYLSLALDALDKRTTEIFPTYLNKTQKKQPQ